MTKLSWKHCKSTLQDKYSLGEKRRELHHTGIYWVRKRNRKARLSKRDGWSQIGRGMWWLLKDNYLIGAVSFCKQDGMYYARITDTIGFKTFTLVADAIKWTEDTTKELFELKDLKISKGGSMELTLAECKGCKKHWFNGVGLEMCDNDWNCPKNCPKQIHRNPLPGTCKDNLRYSKIFKGTEKQHPLQ